jgi:hypothetical protein
VHSPSPLFWLSSGPSRCCPAAVADGRAPPVIVDLESESDGGRTRPRADLPARARKAAGPRPRRFLATYKGRRPSPCCTASPPTHNPSTHRRCSPSAVARRRCHPGSPPLSPSGAHCHPGVFPLAIGAPSSWSAARLHTPPCAAARRRPVAAGRAGAASAPSDLHLTVQIVSTPRSKHPNRSTQRLRSPPLDLDPMD